jgi:hypothetical protein
MDREGFCRLQYTRKHGQITEFWDWKVTEWFRQSNSRVIKALRDHLLPKKEKVGPKASQLRQLFMTSQITSIINGDHEEIDLEEANRIWDMPVVKLWADILTLFEGKGRSGSSGFWSLMCAAVTLRVSIPKSRDNRVILQWPVMTYNTFGTGSSRCTRTKISCNGNPLVDVRTGARHADGRLSGLWNRHGLKWINAACGCGGFIQN